MNFNFSSLIFVTVLLIHVTSCSYIKSLFPDKEKDYQYTTQIAPLSIPDDLKKKPSSVTTEPKLPDTSAQTDATDTAITSENAGNLNKESAAPVVENIQKYEKISVELIRFNDGENRLRLGTESSRAWRLVSKALSRNSIEVVNRNQAEGFFVVQYDPNEKKVEDGSLWDEAVFIFRGFSSNEKEYFLKLEQYDHITEVIVLDKDQQPLSDDGAGLKLLTLIQTTINTDLADK